MALQPGSAAARLSNLAAMGAPVSSGPIYPLSGELHGEVKSLEDFYAANPDWPPGDLGPLRVALAGMGYEPEGDTVLLDVSGDVHALGLQKYLGSLPKSLQVRSIAATQRFLQRLTGEEGTEPTQPSAGTGASADPQMQEQERIRTKVTVGQLAKALEMGTFAPLLLPQDKESLNKVMVAAQIGHYPCPENPPKGDSRLLARGLLDLLRSGVASLLTKRVTPAALLSEMGIALELALEERIPAGDAERVALAYSHKVRKLLHESSLNEPLNPGTDPINYAASMSVFLRRDPALSAEARDELGVAFTQTGGLGSRVRPHTSLEISASNPEHGFCLRYAAGEHLCPGPKGKVCKFKHSCPYCDGRMCQHKAGYLAKHLGGLQKPLEIKEKQWTEWPKRNSGGWNRRPSPARSPRRSRSPHRVKREQR